jgi:hypothetical protein
MNGCANTRRQGWCGPGCGGAYWRRSIQMLKKGEYHYGRDPANYEMKMAYYRRFLEKQKTRRFHKKLLDFYHRTLASLVLAFRVLST